MVGPERKESAMLQGKDAAATIAVSDVERAREFYEGTLGLTAIQADPGGILYKTGSSVILVYPSEFAGTNKATAATWAVGDDFDAIVGGLAESGTTRFTAAMASGPRARTTM